MALLGALGALATFFVTASFLFTAPVTEPSLGGFPALSVVPGPVPAQDIVLLAAAVFLSGDALRRIAPDTVSPTKPHRKWGKTQRQESDP